MKYLYGLCLIFFTLVLGACKKNINSDSNPNNATLSFSTFTPTSGGGGTSVYLKGTGFIADTSKEVVMFNGVRAKIVYVDTSVYQLFGIIGMVVSVPVGATTGKITVTVNGKTVTSTDDFHIATVSTLAGADAAGYADGNGDAARFNNPTRLAADPFGNVYVIDHGNAKVRKISPSGNVSTVAFTFYSPNGIAADDSGNIYVADDGGTITNGFIVKISASGTVSNVTSGAGNSVIYKVTDIAYCKDFWGPSLYVIGVTYPGSHSFYEAIVRVPLDTPDLYYPVFGSNLFNSLATNSSGLYVFGEDVNNLDGSHAANSNLLHIPFINIKSDLGAYTAWSFDYILDSMSLWQYEFPDGRVTANKVDARTICADNSCLYAASGPYTTSPHSVNMRVVKIYAPPADAPGGFNDSRMITIVAGNGIAGHVDGNATTAQFGLINGIAEDASGNLYVADGNCIRKIKQ